LGMTPLIARGVRLWRAGDYTAPAASWRSGPGGVDLLTVAFGNPRHPLTGPATRGIYERLGIDPIEGVARPGDVPLLLAIHRAIRYRRQPETRLWIAIAAVFF